jgi:HD-GYP domain-containing protein (c-di-GMP phosphodiesterase class II)
MSQGVSDNIKIGSVAETNNEDVDELGRAYSEKLQQMGKSVFSSLYMLVRSVKLYDPENEIFEKPIASLVETMNQIIAKEGKFELQGLKDSFYLNNMLVKVEVSSLDNVRELLAELRAKDVGALTLTRPTNVADIKNFVWIFSKDQTETANEQGVGDRKLLSMKLTRWTKIKEKLDKDEMDNPDEQKVDRKKYAMTVYARGVVYVRKYLETVRATGQVLNGTKASRIIQDFVDISNEQRTHFLGMSTLKDDDDYLAFHQVNTALTSIVLGGELKLSKAALRELGLAAMFHDSGMAFMPKEMINRKGALSKEQKTELLRAPVMAVRGILREKVLNRITLTRLVITQEHKQDFGTAVKDSRGNIQMIIPKTNLALYSKIISICCTYDALTSKRPYRDAYGPQIALMLMWTEMRNRFDPELLKVFMNVMAIQPIKMLKNRNIQVG